LARLVTTSGHHGVDIPPARGRIEQRRRALPYDALPVEDELITLTAVRVEKPPLSVILSRRQRGAERGRYPAADSAFKT